MNKILVTGGAGFIGSCLAKFLLEKGNVVYILDDLSKGKKSNIPHAANFIEGKCEDSKSYETIRDIKFSAIFHLAGQSSGERSFEDPLVDLNSNAASTLVLLQFARTNLKGRFVFASTMSVYGDNIPPFKEEMPPRPLSFYGVGKLASEHYLRLYRKFGLDTVAVRLFNVYGPGQDLEDMKQGMVSIFLGQALESGTILVKGSVNRYRDFIFIDDVVDNLWHLSKQNGKLPLVINFASGQSTTVSELLNQIKLGWFSPLEIEVSTGTSGDQHGSVGDNTLGLQYGISFPTRLDEGITATIRWIKELSK